MTAKPSSVASISRRARAGPSTTVAIRSDSLWRSSSAPETTVSPSAKQPASATSGSSSIASGTSPRADPGRLQRPGAGDDRRHRLAAGGRGLDHLDRGPHPGQDPEQADPARVDADALEPDLAAADEQRGDDEEGGRGEVARDLDLAGLEPLRRARP